MSFKSSAKNFTRPTKRPTHRLDMNWPLPNSSCMSAKLILHLKIRYTGQVESIYISVHGTQDSS